MHHQNTELLAGNYSKHEKATKQKAQNHRPTDQMSKKSFDLKRVDKQSDRCIRCGDTSHTKGFQCPVKKFQCKVCHKFGHFTSVCYQKNQQTSGSFIPRKVRHTNFKQGPCTHPDDGRNISEESNTDESFCLQMKVQKTKLTYPQLPKPIYLMVNLVYHLQMHHRQN